MKVLIAGASGGVGSRLAALLADRHEVVAASRSSGIDTISGSGLGPALRGVQVVVDVTNTRSRDPDEVMRFFDTSTRNLTTGAREAGAAHHIMLSVVGADRMQESGYMRGKVAQERVVAASGVPFTILRATQFHEFVAGFGDVFGSDTDVRVPAANMQPIAIDDVAEALSIIVNGHPANAVAEVGGPAVMSIRDAVSRILESRGDRRPVAASKSVRYFGAAIEGDTLVPGRDARRGTLSLNDWLSRRH
jgi:uncharacterized protein YbjT (DUF2867 family)